MRSTAAWPGSDAATPPIYARCYRRGVLYIAAALIALLAIAHSIIGELRLIGPIAARDDLPRLYGTTAFTGATLRFAWHVTSLLALGVAVVLVELAAGADVGLLAATIGWTLIACGMLPLIFTRGGTSRGSSSSSPAPCA